MPVSEAQKRATTKYEKEVYKKILLRIRADGKSDILNYDELQIAIGQSGKTTNGYILEAIKEKIVRDQEARKSKK
jgi:hypothetical protein